MMEANEEQLRQRRERREADKIEEDRLVQIMFDKFKVCTPCLCPHLALLPSDVCVFVECDAGILSLSAPRTFPTCCMATFMSFCSNIVLT